MLDGRIALVYTRELSSALKLIVDEEFAKEGDKIKRVHSTIPSQRLTLNQKFKWESR